MQIKFHQLALIWLIFVPQLRADSSINYIQKSEVLDGYFGKNPTIAAIGIKIEGNPISDIDKDFKSAKIINYSDIPDAVQPFLKEDYDDCFAKLMDLNGDGINEKALVGVFEGNTLDIENHSVSRGTFLLILSRGHNNRWEKVALFKYLSDTYPTYLHSEGGDLYWGFFYGNAQHRVKWNGEHYDLILGYHTIEE